MFLWMTWMFQLHNRNQLETKVIPHFQRRKKRFLMQVIFLLHLMMLPLYWWKVYGPLALKLVRVSSEVVIQQKSEMTIQESALKLYPTLCEVEGLTEDERYRTLSKISDHPTQMLIFFSLPSAVRLE